MSRLACSWYVVAVAISLFPAKLVHAADKALDDQVARAIARGVAYLKEVQESGGRWGFTFNLDHDLGMTSLAGLALLENGVESTDPSIVKATRLVVKLAENANQTYDLALAILFLARVEPSGSGRTHDALIVRLADRLSAGGPEGCWSYQVPLSGDEPTTGTGSRKAATGSGSKKRRPTPLERMLSSGGDNSNTQFALLGIWAAGRHGFASNDPLEAIDHHFRESQDNRGRWGYRPHMQGADAMTCAGLMGLAIAAARPRQAERLSARARGAALASDPVFASALKAVTADAHAIGPFSDIYYLWSLERVCVALGLRELDGFDWYRAALANCSTASASTEAGPNQGGGPCRTPASPSSSSERPTSRSSSIACSSFLPRTSPSRSTSSKTSRSMNPSRLIPPAVAISA